MEPAGDNEQKDNKYLSECIQMDVHLHLLTTYNC